MATIYFCSAIYFYSQFTCAWFGPICTIDKNIFVSIVSQVQFWCVKLAIFGTNFVHCAAQQTTVPQWHLISCQFCWQRPYSLVRYIGFLSSCGALKCTSFCFWRKRSNGIRKILERKTKHMISQDIIIANAETAILFCLYWSF